MSVARTSTCCPSLQKLPEHKYPRRVESSSAMVPKLSKMRNIPVHNFQISALLSGIRTIEVSVRARPEEPDSIKGWIVKFSYVILQTTPESPFNSQGCLLFQFTLGFVLRQLESGNGRFLSGLLGMRCPTPWSEE